MSERIDQNHPLYSKATARIEVAGMYLNFQRTTRVPEGELSGLPAGLGSFPLYKVADFKSGCPEDWHAEGYFMPMYPQEAMWMNFPNSFASQHPFAMMVAAGNINAVTGKQIPYKNVKGKRGAQTLEIRLEDPQNYLVVPPQPWLDGWKAPDDKIYQFVAAELGSGQTVEGQITGKEDVGGIQIAVFHPKPGLDLIPKSRPREYIESGGLLGYDGPALMSLGGSSHMRGAFASKSLTAMGLGRGGEIRQKVYDDPHGLQVWQEEPAGKTLLYIVSSEGFQEITGVAAPPTPVPYAEYQKKGMPWFEVHDGKLKDTPGSDVFEKLQPVTTGKKEEAKKGKK